MGRGAIRWFALLAGVAYVLATALLWRPRPVRFVMLVLYRLEDEVVAIEMFIVSIVGVSVRLRLVSRSGEGE